MGSKTTVPPREDGLPTVGMALIARDEADQIARCFDSFWEHVDQVVLVDTGSTDDTLDVARAYAEARGEPRKLVTDTFEWIEDFSAARQVSWDLLGTDFGSWCDLDDEIRGAEKLRALAVRMPPEIAFLLVPYDYARDDNGNTICRLERERLIRVGIGEKWELPIHEVLRIPGQPVRCLDMEWVHHPKAKPDPKRNYKILKRDLERSKEAGEDPNPRTLVYLGTEALALGKRREAIRWLRAYVKAGTWDEELCQAYHKLSIAHRMLDELDRAQEAARLAIDARPDWPDGYLDLAEIAVRRDQPEQALRFCEKAEACGIPETLLIINPMEYRYQPVVLRSIALAKLGRAEEAYEATNRALEMTPERPDLAGQGFWLAQAVKANETVGHALALYELLVRHDENLKALALLENVPYYIHDHPAVALARANQRENVLHATDPEVYAAYYRENPGETPFEAQEVPIPEAHKAFRRVEFLREGLEAQATELGKPRRTLRVLDLAGNDGWMAANLADAGWTCDVIELNAGAADRASERKDTYPRMGDVVCDDLHHADEHFEPHSYDAVVAFEVIEHVPDPERLLDVMSQMCAPGGRCYVSTPDGAYEMGNIPDWSRVESKGHLRAIRPPDLAKWLCARGVVEALECEQRLIHAAFRPSPRKGKVVFYAGAPFVDPRPEKILAEGLGGSETALCKMAELFARRGYEVTVYAGEHSSDLRGDRITTDEQLPLQGNVSYAPAAAWDPGERCDLFVSSRLPEAFDRTIASERRVLWLHDADYGPRLTEERVSRCTDVIVLSKFQRELLTDKYPFLAERCWVSRNGIEPKWFEGLQAGPREPWVVYSSSPDRGLDVLLECWPAVRERVPGAELHTCYAPVYYEMKDRFDDLAAYHRKLEQLMDTEGVVNHVSLGQKALAELYMKATVWAYPSWTTMHGGAFPEISCISAMEAQAAGCVPVTLKHGALTETVVTGELIPASSVVVPGGPAPLSGKLTDEWRAQFVDAIVRGLTDRKWAGRCASEGRLHAKSLGWEGVVDAWEERFLAPAREPAAAV